MVALIIRGATIDGWCWAGAGHAVQCISLAKRRDGNQYSADLQRIDDLLQVSTFPCYSRRLRCSEVSLLGRSGWWRRRFAKRCDFGFDWVKTRYIIQGCAESSELPEAVAGEESAKTFGLTGF